VNAAPSVRRVLEAVVRDRRTPVSVDASALQHIDSSGVAALTALLEGGAQPRGHGAPRGLSGQPGAQWRLLRLDRVFD
jgi:anti-anti-sigma regulatory factor